MAFFNLSKKLQVVLIASGLAVSPAGCKPPGEKPPIEPGEDKVDRGECKSLDILGIEVWVTRSSANRSTLALKLKGSIPEGTELEEALAGKGLEVMRSGVGEDGVLSVEIAHGGLKPGDVGILLVDIKTTCGKHKAKYRDRISICKQAGGLKILEGTDAVCQSAPVDQKVDAGTIIVDPVPYPVDPPPPPPDPVPYPVDPVPYPGDPPPPPPDPVPPPPPVKDPVPHPMDALIYDCVPDAMGPAAAASLEVKAGHAADRIQPSIMDRLQEDGTWLLGVVDRLGSDPSGMRITWSCSGGTLERQSGPVTRWTPPGENEVHAVMAVIEKDGHVLVETWKCFPERDVE